MPAIASLSPGTKASRIAFRADASSTLGMGHIARCRVLAHALTRMGHAIVFLCRALPGDARELLHQEGFPVLTLDLLSGSAESAEASLNALSTWGDTLDWLVVDHYALDKTWESALRARTQQILVIDDLPGRPHDADLLVDANFRLTPVPWPKLLPARCRILSGVRYALLRPEFEQVRAAGLRERNGQVKHLCLCFGGSDPGGYTQASVLALSRLKPPPTIIDVVIGQSNPQPEAIKAICRQHLPQATVHHPASNLADLLAAADLVIGASGTMNWERACLGAPSLVFAIADNQIAGLDALVEAGIVVGAHLPEASEELIFHYLNSVLNSPALLRGLSRRSATLCDGHGVTRVTQAMLPTVIQLRPANLADRDHLFLWRNHPYIRAISFQTEPITYEAHCQWFSQTLKNRKIHLLIAEESGQPAGVIRFDLDGSSATLSVYQIPESSGSKGLIATACAWLQETEPAVQRIQAEVLASNPDSQAAFLAAGFRVVHQRLCKENAS